jgi:hypothetical protein
MSWKRLLLFLLILLTTLDAIGQVDSSAESRLQLVRGIVERIDPTLLAEQPRIYEDREGGACGFSISVSGKQAIRNGVN